MFTTLCPYRRFSSLTHEIHDQLNVYMQSDVYVYIVQVKYWDKTPFMVTSRIIEYFFFCLDLSFLVIFSIKKLWQHKTKTKWKYYSILTSRLSSCGFLQTRSERIWYFTFYPKNLVSWITWGFFYKFKNIFLKKVMLVSKVDHAEKPRKYDIPRYG